MEPTDTATRARVPHLQTVAALALSALMGAGCTVIGNHESPLPRDGTTMAEVYRNHMSGGALEGETATPRDRLPSRGADDDAVVEQRRALSDPLNNRFERLPNPDLTLHVFPHLAQGRYPVPGYDTVFPMYESVHYAMPGEVAPRYKSGDSFTYPTPSTGRLAQPADAQAVASADARRKANRLSELLLVAPSHARVLNEYDRQYTQRCGATLSTEQLFAVPSSGAPAFDRMLALAYAGRDGDAMRAGAELMRCDAPQAQKTAATKPAAAAPTPKEPG